MKEKNIKPPERRLVTPLWQKVIYEACWYPDKATRKELEHIVIPARYFGDENWCILT